jgi:hypothetical protein
MNRWFEYTKYDPLEVRIYKGIFWCGVLLLVIWCEIVIGLAVYLYILP